MIERLQKILSRAGVASRRAAEELIAQGRVSVNGVTVQELGTKADASVDSIRVDDRRIRPTVENVYLLLNKPKGVVSTRSDPEGRKTVMDLVPKFPGLYPVGTSTTRPKVSFSSPTMGLLPNGWPIRAMRSNVAITRR